VSVDFNFSKSIRTAGPSATYAIHSVLVNPLKTPSAKLGLRGELKHQKFRRSDLNHVVTDSRPLTFFDGHHLFIHDPFEVLSDSSFQFYTLPNTTTEYLIAPKILTFDESLKDFDLDE
jgi:hypothetical protein